MAVAISARRPLCIKASSESDLTNRSLGIHTAAILGYLLAFGLMGLWHGTEPHYIVYGFYQATLLSAFHIFSSWKRFISSGAKAPPGMHSPLFVTFNAVCFGLLIFSRRIGAAPAVQHPLEKVSTLKDVF